MMTVVVVEDVERLFSVFVLESFARLGAGCGAC